MHSSNFAHQYNETKKCTQAAISTLKGSKHGQMLANSYLLHFKLGRISPQLSALFEENYSLFEIVPNVWVLFFRQQQLKKDIALKLAEGAVPMEEDTPAEEAAEGVSET